MQPVTVTMERVFDVVRRRGRHGRYTEFSFVRAGVTHYAVRAPGWPVVESGMTVSVLLARQDDWRAIVGWVHHSSGELAAPEVGRWIVPVIGALLVTTLTSIQWESLAPVIVASPVYLGCSFVAYRNMRVQRALRALVPVSRRQPPTAGDP
jgi:hypothetical protein